MIVARVTDPVLLRAIAFAASREEDVVSEPGSIDDALRRGFPRLLVRDQQAMADTKPEGVPVVDLGEVLLRRWETEWRSAERPRTWTAFLTERLRGEFGPLSGHATWVDAALADLSRAAGARLPFPLRAFARRVLEFPARYTSLRAVATGCGLSRGALKAKFWRRGLSSPSVYLRWFRVMAVAEVLSDRSVTVSAAAHRLGFTSPGNMCRTMAALTRVTPTEARTVRGWNTLLLSFAWMYLTPAALDAWSELEDLFARRVA
jgi:AraC-like DNA-binding protein